MRILVIEDTIPILTNIVDYLSGLGYIVDCSDDGQAGYERLCRDEFDLVVLDLMLPRMDGYELCRRLRCELRSTIPVIMVTARDALDDRLAGFDAGADDYLVKPFALAELGARIRALLQRRRSAAPSVLKVGDLSLDQDTLALERAGTPLKLPPAPLTLLRLLMLHSPAVVHRTRLEEALWHDSPPDSDALRTHIHHIRQVIDKPFEQPLLHTVHGIGYQLRAQ
ncbi:DNA-binding response regulator [Bordetella sp. J329]|jgi:DNA-binding response OmpR family regulator|uniref:response regulator transcription factor n=1 Tax=Kerstersia gyiorum TaxID=206506 RepID=UPI000FD83E73|nr:response regulator transcription factor [Kerstersia gyiorum]AZV92668.1 DNA-binding response regulator [Bordetella sp. J329]MCH4270913.1 response regulator transcription factor [Kerstersia gyiorum]MCI1229393.1 response regulator transcription factor [Kerstersia gyiorum]